MLIQCDRFIRDKAIVLSEKIIKKQIRGANSNLSSRESSWLSSGENHELSRSSYREY